MAAPKQEEKQQEKDEEKVVLSDEEWKKKLTKEEYNVLRLKHTEPGDNRGYTKQYPNEGYFVCKACSNPLYSYAAKFNSGCGWPAFDKCFKNSVKTLIDADGYRIEILCKKCDGHLGHVFVGEHFNKSKISRTDQRHCVNSICLKYVKGALPKELQEAELDLGKK
mmetsp:Transcript_11491/g.18493  ORF Transcript_11491/g.18493 Transcript_11491/m.18493 type:complete len:165 (-) Transcript_11491:30-524(-)|eukprot:CAMPEP_0197052016 /NCGR_PEP_ID=MMETSP1384-20130603/26557_1 /TAXON_ID=29189 /ORGANISM="Ammonia sp." /LENGTH=164 /DNA_ID=CAMNT_0042484657 /DNA_START=32 /DNA_END=526 /DNA_ORIENTATION=-